MALYQTLYRKWRPQTFDDVCGQEHISSILRYEVMEGRTSHAYLFCGSRGTGKTTCAKLLARALNCEHPENGNPCGICTTCRGILSGAITDVIEMDAASNNGVDNIRDIRDDVAYAPTACKKRVFIIDEVHMLSTSAFNALLKTLEEPPEHIVFILATTELHKIPATILSRCQRFDFRRIDTKTIAARLRTIADAERIRIDDDALYLMAKLAMGGMRDAIGMLELCAASAVDGGMLHTETVAALLGTSPIETTAAVVEAIQKKQYSRIFEEIDALTRDARDIGVFWQALLSFYRDMLVAKTIQDPTPYLDLPENQRSLPITLSKGFSRETLLYHTKILDEVSIALQKNTANARVTAEMALIRMCDASLDDSAAALLSRLSALEDRVALGIPVQKSTASTDTDIPSKSDAETAQWENIPPPSEDTRFPNRFEAPPKAAPKPVSKPQLQQKKVLRAFRFWPDVVKKIESTDPTVGAFLRTYKAYTCEQNGKFYLHAPDSFSIMLLNAQLDRTMLRNALQVSSGETFTDADIIIENHAAAKTDAYETIDALIDAAETAETSKENDET